MGNVKVAAHYNRFFLVEINQIVAEVIFPAHAVVQAFQSVLAIGDIHIHKEELLHLEGYHAALMVVLVDSYAQGHSKRLVACVDGGA